jgi:transcriptional regulator with XRE-family HTH domain
MASTSNAKPATRAEVAIYGHIAARLRAFLTERKMSIPDLSEALGLGRGSATAYKWLGAHGGPAAKMRAKLAKVTGIPEAELMPRKPGAAPAPSQAVAVVTSPAKLAPARVGDVLSFAVAVDGSARLRLDIVLPIASATPLLRMLLDAGIVFGGEPVA